MKNIKVNLISLGCEKNLVDSETILGMISCKAEIVDNIKKADLIIINTCGFINPAKEEAINTIFDSIQEKRKDAKVVVTGCLVQRYLDDLKREIPEVDLWIPLRDYHRFGELLSNLLNDDSYKALYIENNNRVISTPKHLAYVKISDGCNNCCTYCAIPLIRGSFRSFKEEEIITEVKYLVKTGRKEICLISQDLTKYGIDLPDTSLASLLKKIVAIPGDYHLRLLYLYPDEITDELITVIKENEKIYNYFDIPIQHASNKLLKWMNRRGTKEEIKALINKIRKEIPEAVIRTTIIVGFPHESEKDFNELLEFIKEVKFEHLGAFTYSKEEDTKAYLMTNQVAKRIKEERYNKLLETQKWISLEQNKKHLNKIYPCIIEKYDEDTKTYRGRNYSFAPDDIDGEIIIGSTEKLEIGNIYNCKITDIEFYDLKAEVVK